MAMRAQPASSDNVAVTGLTILPKPSWPQQFRYEDLDRSTESLRLIKVLRDRNLDGLLQIELSHHTLPTTYRCLSYQWGARTKSHKVLINQHEFFIGENLHDFLSQTQTWAQNGFEDYLWIDAICINQERIDERGHQVQRMGTIYASALEVFIWLGCHSDLTDAFHDWLHEGEHHNCPSALRECWDRIRFNDYWHRAWIVQEILLAKHVTVILPGAKVDWTVLGRAIARSGSIDSLDRECAAHLWSFWDERWRRTPQSSAKKSRWLPNGKPVNRLELDSLWSLIHMHRHAQCTDKRDRIYSLLGLVHADHDFRVDYGESVMDLFWRAGEHFNAWDAPELVDILRVALLQDTGDDGNETGSTSPWRLVRSLETKSDLHVRIPVRHILPANSLRSRLTKRIKCRVPDCRDAPALHCTRDDLLLCTNTPPEGPTAHGCIHGLCHPLDSPAAEPFVIKLTAHHTNRTVTATLPSSTLQVHDAGTDTWNGVITWSTMEKALQMKNLDRVERVKLSVPARYAIWIWFGIHPDQMQADPNSQRTTMWRARDGSIAKTHDEDNQPNLGPESETDNHTRVIAS
ncbi:hypothetical protein ACN47E_006472 [Coniothyrium glycines]